MKKQLSPDLKGKTEPLINILKNVESIKGRDLAGSLQISERELRLLVNHIRLNVAPNVISGEFGYRWETDAKKITDSLIRLQAHAVSELQAVHGMRKLLTDNLYKV